MIEVTSALVHWIPDISAGDTAVAAGTIVLAVFTFLLARQTKRLAQQTQRDVSFTQRELELTQQSIETQDMPFVILTNQPGRILFWTDGAVVGRLVNIGRGPAIVDHVSLTLAQDSPVVADDGTRQLLRELEAQLPIATDAGADVNLRAKAVPDLGFPDATLAIVYTHSSGSRYRTVSQVRIGWEGGAARNVTCLDFRREAVPG